MWCTFYPHHRSSVTVHVGVCGGGVEQGLIFDFNSGTEYNLYVYLTYILFICLISIMSKALGLQTLGDKLLADLAASWWFLLLGLCFSFLFTFPLLVLFSFLCVFLCKCFFSLFVLSFLWWAWLERGFPLPWYVEILPKYSQVFFFLWLLLFFGF